MRHCHRATEEIAAGEYQDLAAMQEMELPEQQQRGDQIVDDERGLIDRNECLDRGERPLGEWNYRRERGGRDQHYGDGEATFRCRRRMDD